MFIAALFTTAKIWKQPKCPSTDRWTKKMWHARARARAHTHTHTHGNFVCVCAQSCPALCDPVRLLCPWDFPVKHTGVEKEYIWISSEMDETGANYTEWSKPERKTPIQYTNTYIWNLGRWQWPCMQDRKKDTDVYNGLLDSEGEGEAGMIWENGNSNMYTIM